MCTGPRAERSGISWLPVKVPEYMYRYLTKIPMKSMRKIKYGTCTNSIKYTCKYQYLRAHLPYSYPSDQTLNSKRNEIYRCATFRPGNPKILHVPDTQPIATSTLLYPSIPLHTPPFNLISFNTTPPHLHQLHSLPPTTPSPPSTHIHHLSSPTLQCRSTTANGTRLLRT